ncbi:BamA/TamA family outer membrane protein [Flavobacterium sp.]|uniref:translocation and assembly module lipoprotein TamL n=1 Tax=Flavobacterium sp. TaxID=239 RepID=UPI0038FC3D32
MTKNILYFLFLALFASSCSNTKHLPEGELLYTGGKIIVEKSKETTNKERKLLQTESNKLLIPKPNKKFLGLRYRLFFYNLAGDVKKEKGFGHWLKYTVGEPPVLFSQVDLQFNKSLLQNYVENNGYFNAKTTADSTRNGKKVEANYNINTKQQYKIKSVQFPTDSADISIEIYKTQLRSLLKDGNPYNLALIKEERVRIDSRLKEKGYFYFNPDYLKIQVDSTVADHQVDLIVKVKNEAPKIGKTSFKINKIIIYPNYGINADSLSVASDSIVKYKDFTIIDNEKLFEPRVFDRVLYFKKNDLYNRTNHNLSLNRLVNLGTFKFVKNQFIVSNTIGNYLDAYYYLTPLTKKSIRVEILAKTNSANYTGTELNVNWSNRNTFRGAELLTISAFGGFEVQLSGEKNGFNVYRFGSEANLIWPRFISPFKLNSSSGFVPRTKATLGYENQNRIKLYSLQTFKAAFGYIWKGNERTEHQLNVTEITFASPQNVSDLYNEQIAANESLRKVVEKQLIFGPTYSYTYTNTMQKRKKNTFFYKGSIDLSGNVTGLVTGANIKKGDTIKIFNIPFSQYVKIQNEFKHNYKLTKTSQISSRIIMGAAFAYGNSDEIPFSKQFFIGGTNSLRAFRSRSLGPGTYNGFNDSSTFLPDQSGDVKLEMNTEYRANIYRFINGALFVDAGNIWLLNDNVNKPGSKFSSKFLDEIAVGVGAGLRFDFSFLVLRTDLAFPIRKPYLPEGQRWVMDKVNFGNGAWLKENLVFNLAIGYPF